MMAARIRREFVAYMTEVLLQPCTPQCAEERGMRIHGPSYVGGPQALGLACLDIKCLSQEQALKSKGILIPSINSSHEETCRRDSDRNLACLFPEVKGSHRPRGGKYVYPA